MHKQHKQSWTKQQIRAARQEQLVAVLQRRGLRLHGSGGDNYKIAEYPGYIIKNVTVQVCDLPKMGEGGRIPDINC